MIWYGIVALTFFAHQVHVRWEDWCSRGGGDQPYERCMSEEPDCVSATQPGEWVFGMGPPIMAEHQVCTYKKLPAFITGGK